jgi:hypothetical protein
MSMVVLLFGDLVALGKFTTTIHHQEEVTHTFKEKHRLPLSTHTKDTTHLPALSFGFMQITSRALPTITP